MFLATRLSKQKKICSSNTLDKIINFYKKNNLPNDLKKYSLNRSLGRIVEHMKNDKKNKDSRISLILLKHIGKTTRPDSIKMSPRQVKIALKKIS